MRPPQIYLTPSPQIQLDPRQDPNPAFNPSVRHLSFENLHCAFPDIQPGSKYYGTETIDLLHIGHLLPYVIRQLQSREIPRVACILLLSPEDN